MLCKSDLSACSNTSPNYTYGAVVTNGSVSRSMPHAVASITGSVHGQTNPNYTYDYNGNMTAGAGISYTYTSFNMPITMSKTGFSDTFTYGPDHQRVKQVSVSSGVTRTQL